MRGRRRMAALAVVLGLACAAGVSFAAVHAASGATQTSAAGCQLGSGGQIKHVIYIQFDNTHFRRDNPNVPSDLEQMPHLLNFIRGNGSLLTDDHTALISHTATGILTSLTGVYPDRMGQPVSNSFRYFKTDGTTRTGVSFAYWTAPLFDPAGSTTDTTPEMINENGKIAPAPWVPFTRAGCDFGAVATANTILENTALDVPTVFGAGSPEAAEVASNPGQAFADFVGIGPAGNIHFAYGPGEAGYVQQLHDYDLAFQKFFNRLAADGINKSNTLFVFTVDEGDHFVGDAPTPAGCDGVTTACTYNRVGEINADLRRMVYTQFGDSTLFSVHSDDAPPVYVNGTPAQPIRDQTDPAVRSLEREMAQLNWLNPYTGQVENNIMVGLADHTGMKTLHMVTADPFRTPTFTPFADPDWFFFATGGSTPTACATPAACAFIPARTNQSFAWNHGDIQDEIASTWIGMVGPGVDPNASPDQTWTDHPALRPTMLSLVGLKDDYGHDGRLLSGDLSGYAIPAAVKKNLTGFTQLADAYKQLNASFGTFAMNILKASTHALASNDAGDGTYN